MNKLIVTFLVSLTASLTVPTIASAGPNGDEVRDHRSQRDRKVRDHRSVRRQRRLAKFDADKNGILDPAEREAMLHARRARRAKRYVKILARRDSNGDGKLSGKEFVRPKKGKKGKRVNNANRAKRVVRRTAKRARLFARADINNDGYMSKAEFVTVEKPKHKRGGRGKRRHRVRDHRTDR